MKEARKSKGEDMVKKPNGRRKSVMREVHPDLKDKIETFTDPERIERARAQLVDYARVAEQFASSELPDDGDETQDSVLAAPVIAPIVSRPEEDRSLLTELEDTSRDQEPAWIRESMDDDDAPAATRDSVPDLDEMLGADTLHAAHVAPVRLDADFPQTDLFDDDAPAGGAGTRRDEDDDDSGIFGVPNSLREPTPYGDRSAERKGDDDGALDDYMFGDGNKSSSDPQSLMGWMHDDGDEDLPDVPTPHGTGSVPNAMDEGLIFDDEDETRPRRAQPAASQEALADVMGLNAYSVPPPVDEAAVGDEDPDAVVIPAAPVPVARKRRLGLFGKRKRVEETVVESDALGDRTETTVITDTVETVHGPAAEKHIVVKKKKNGGLRMIASVVALSVLGAGGYYLADNAGLIPSPPGPEITRVDPNRLVPGDGERTDTLMDPAPITSVNPAPDIPVDNSGTPGGDPSLSGTAPQGDAPLETFPAADPVVKVESDGTRVTTYSVPLVDGEGKGQAPGGQTVIAGDGTPTEVVAVEILPEGAEVLPVEEPAPASQTGAATDPENTAAEVAEPEEPAQMFEDLYAAGVSASEAQNANREDVLAKMAQLTRVMEDQRKALDSAVSRVQTLEAVIADKDEIIASAQVAAESARGTANEAKEIAMAQNRLLLEVVGMQDALRIAEELIVDLSRRTAAVESDNSDTVQIDFLNQRVKELGRDVGLLARTVLTNGQNLERTRAAQANADAAHAEAQAAVDAQAQSIMDGQTQPAPAGSAGVYANEQRLMSPNSQQAAVDIPDDVKVGDDLPVYGKVIAIDVTEDGRRMLTGEHSSVLLPREAD